MGQRSQWTFHEEGIHMAIKHLKRCSASLMVRGRPFKSPVSYHLTPVEWPSQRIPSNTCCRGCGEKGTPLHSWWECKSVYPLGKEYEVSFKILNIVLQPHVPGNKLMQKDNADSGVQFITPAGPRQSLLLAKDADQICENIVYPKCIRFPETNLNKGKRKIQS